jgi:RNA polymerase sigma factor (sigma-70 family)
MKDLINQLPGSDPSSEEKLYRLLLYKTYPKILRFLLNRGRSEADAEDLFQDAFMAFVKSVKNGNFSLKVMTFKTDLDQIESFMMGTVKNLWKKLEEKDKRKPIGIFDTHPGGLEPEFLSGIVTEKFQELDSAIRVVMTAFFFDKLSFKEIGKREIPPKNARAMKRTFQKCIQQFLESINEEIKNELDHRRLELISAEAILELSERCQKMLKHFYSREDKKSMIEIAELLGYASEGAAKVAKNECINTLRIKVAEKLMET